MIDVQALWGVSFIVAAKVYLALCTRKSIDNLHLLILAEVAVFEYECFEVGLALQRYYQ